MSGPVAPPQVVASREGGFVLAMVVMLLFAIAVAGTTGYLVVNTEFALATADKDGREALAVARAGLQRFVAEQIGQVGDSVTYAIGNGITLVTAVKVVEEDSLNHLYYVRSEATVTDIRTPDLPTRRTVGAYAWHRLKPIPHKGAVWTSGGSITLYGLNDDAIVDGYDQASSGDCSGGGTAGVSGAIRVGSIGYSFGSYTKSYTGNPASTAYADYAAVYDSANIRWDVLENPLFPVDFEATSSDPPDYGSLPADSFPITRYDEDLNAYSAHSGRGVLIVTGRLRSYSGFTWDGIILAGELGFSLGNPGPVVNGMVIGGLDESNPNTPIYDGTFNYHSCNVYSANASLSYLELMENTLHELE